jgi:hypothetical protein
MEELLESRKQQTPEEGRDENKDENPESRKRYAPDDGHDSDDESNAVPLKRKKTLGLIPPTDTTILKADALRDFTVTRKPFRNHYSYLPPGHIRILVIKPRKTDNFYEPLDLELVPELLINPSEPYEALSYEWGDTFPRHKVTVHDSTVSLRDRIDAILSASGTSKETRKLCMREMARLLIRSMFYNRNRTPETEALWSPIRLVRENLHNALLYFRRKEPVRLWVDALCIYPIRSGFSYRRFWRHLPPKTTIGALSSALKKLFVVASSCLIKEFSFLAIPVEVIATFGYMFSYKPTRGNF